MWPIATVVVWSVCMSVYLFVTTVSPTKTAKLIRVPFGVQTVERGARNHVIGPDPPQKNQLGRRCGVTTVATCYYSCHRNHPFIIIIISC